MSVELDKEALVVWLEENRERLRGFRVARLGLFGSFLRGEGTPESDIDLLVEFDAGCKTFDNFMGVVFLLEDALHRPVELLTPESLSPYLGPRILSEVEYVFAA